MEPRWEETRTILRQLEGVFHDDSELALLIKQRTSEVQAIYVKSQADIRHSIRELAKQVCGEDGPIDRVDAGIAAATAMHNGQITSLNAAGAAATHTVDTLRQEEAELLSQLRAFETAIAQTGDEERRLDAKREAEIPRVKHSISLYTNITGIRWDAPTSEGVVSGCIIPASGDGCMKTFEFKPCDANRYEVANRLWDLVAASSGTA